MYEAEKGPGGTNRLRAVSKRSCMIRQKEQICKGVRSRSEQQLVTPPQDMGIVTSTDMLCLI